MKNYMAIKREDGTVFLQRSEPETASEPPLSEYELLILELARKLEKLETSDNSDYVKCPMCGKKSGLHEIRS